MTSPSARSRSATRAPSPKPEGPALLPAALTVEHYRPYEADRVTSWLAVGGHFHDPRDDGEEKGCCDEVWHDGRMLAALKARGVTDVLNTAAEIHERGPVTDAGLGYFKVPWVDQFAHDTAAPDPDEAFRHALLGYTTGLTFALQRARAAGLAGKRFLLYVHCHGGKHRGPLMATFLLGALGGLDGIEAYARVRRARPAATAFDVPSYRHSCLDALYALAPYIKGITTDEALDGLMRLLDELVRADPDPEGGGLDHPIHHLGRLSPGVTEEETPAGIRRRYALDQDTARAIAGRLYAAMRATFLARWRELGNFGAPPPRAALSRLEQESHAAAASIVRTHNRELANLVDRLAARHMATAPDGAGLGAALHPQLAAHLDARAVRRSALVASYHTGLASSLADLYGSPDGGLMVLDGPELTAASCAECRAHFGRVVPAREAWETLFPAHLNCEHVWRQATPAEAATLPR